ncbi:conjugal transfer protein TraD, partial [Enterococcus faecalis]
KITKIIKIKGGCNMSKSTAQQIADLQNKLQALRTKKARQDRREETRQKIILGAEVAKVLDKKPEEINKALILGLLSKINELDEEEKRDFTRIGMDILQQWKS